MQIISLANSKIVTSPTYVHDTRVVNIWLAIVMLHDHELVFHINIQLYIDSAWHYYTHITHNSKQNIIAITNHGAYILN